MNEKNFGKAVLGATGSCLIATLLVPGIRNGRVFWLFVISLCLGGLAVSAYLRFRERHKRVTPMSVIGWLWVVFCLPFLMFLTAVFADQSARHSDLFRAAMSAALNNEKVVGEVGVSPKIGWPIEEPATNDPDITILSIPVKGIHGIGALRARGDKVSGVWKLEALDLKLPNGEVWEIVKGPDEARTSSSPVKRDAEAAVSDRGVSPNSSWASHGLLSPWYMIIICCVLGPIFFIIAIPYTLTLQNALLKCAPECRAMHPSLLWMLLIPFVGLISNFFVVSDMTDSFRAEFARRGIPDIESTTKKIGMTMSICWVCSFFPLVGIPAVIASPVLWIVYWRRIAKLSRRLDSMPATSA